MKIAKAGKHTLGLAALRARVDARIGVYTQRFPHLNIAEHYKWVDDRHARAEYRGGVAEVTLGEDEVMLVLDLPFFARIYRGKISDFAQREIDVVTSAEHDPASASGSL